MLVLVAPAGLEAAAPTPAALVPVVPAAGLADELTAPVTGLAEAAVLTLIEALAPVEVVETLPPHAAKPAMDPAAKSAMPS